MGKYDAPCSMCGQNLPGTPKSLPAGRRTCHSCRRERSGPYLQPQVYEHSCVICGQRFLHPAAGAKYCRAPCSPRVRMATGGPCGEVGCLKVSRKRGLCCTHYNRRYQPHRSHGPVSIAEWRKLNPDRVSKGYEIKRRRRRARKALAKTERYTLAEIATRDRFICQLCGKRVAMSETVPHPRAPTIDHIIPFAEVPDDTRANVQLAHFLCNSRKGARGTPQQLALFG